MKRENMMKSFFITTGLLLATLTTPADAIDGVWFSFDNNVDAIDHFRDTPGGHEAVMFKFHRDGIWWALKSQRDMALQEPITNTLHIGSHNAANARRHGARQVGLIGHNQTFAIPEVLSVGARYVEVDVTLLGAQSVPPSLVTYHFDRVLSGWNPLGDIIGETAEWVNRAENRNEVVIIDFEDNIGPDYWRCEITVEINLNMVSEPIVIKSVDFCTPPEGNDDGIWQVIDDFLGTLNRTSTWRIIWSPDDTARIFREDILLPSFRDSVTGESIIFTPADMAANGGHWPSRQEMIEAGKRVVIMSDVAGRLNGDGSTSDDDIAFKFRGANAAAKQTVTSKYSPDLSNSLQFSRNENADFFHILQGDSLGSFASADNGLIHCRAPNDHQSGGGISGQPRLSPNHVQRAVANNINVLKMDFLLGHNFHVRRYQLKEFVDDHRDGGLNIYEEFFGDLFNNDGKNFCGMDFDDNIEAELWDLPGIGGSYERFRQAVWSWQPGDQAPYRSAYVDLFADDATGNSLYARHISEWDWAINIEYPHFFGDTFWAYNAGNFIHPDDWASIGETATANGLDVASQRFDNGRWNSTAPDEGEYAFALRTISRFSPIPAAKDEIPVPPDLNDLTTLLSSEGSDGVYLWRVSESRGLWQDGGGNLFYPGDALEAEIRQLNMETGTRWFFAGPVNGFQNATLRNAPRPVPDQPLWIKVSDLDRDGYWQVGSELPPLIKVVELDGEVKIKHWFTPTIAPQAMNWWQANAHCEKLSNDHYMGLYNWRLANGEQALHFVWLMENSTYWTEHFFNQVYGTTIELPDGVIQSTLKTDLAIPFCVAELDEGEPFPYPPMGNGKNRGTPGNSTLGSGLNPPSHSHDNESDNAVRGFSDSGTTDLLFLLMLIGWRTIVYSLRLRERLHRR